MSSYHGAMQALYDQEYNERINRINIAERTMTEKHSISQLQERITALSIENSHLYALRIENHKLKLKNNKPKVIICCNIS